MTPYMRIRTYTCITHIYGLSWFVHGCEDTMSSLIPLPSLETLTTRGMAAESFPEILIPIEY